MDLQFLLLGLKAALPEPVEIENIELNHSVIKSLESFMGQLVVIKTVSVEMEFGVLTAQVLADAVGKLETTEFNISIHHTKEYVFFEVKIQKSRFGELFPVVVGALTKLYERLPEIKKEALNLEKSCRK